MSAPTTVTERIITPADAEWPAHLPLVNGPTERIWVCGARLDALTAPAVAIVGSRASTAYGDHMASEFASHLASRNIPVVTTIGFGISAAALRATIAAGGTPIAILPTGLDIDYPMAQAALKQTIAANGLLITANAPGTTPSRLRHLAAHRLPALFSHTTLVVEAGLRSAALHTAACAQELPGRRAAAVPGPATSAVSSGCHALIQNGANIVWDRHSLDAILPNE